MKKSSSSTGRPQAGEPVSTHADPYRFQNVRPNPVEIPPRAQRDINTERALFCPSYDTCLDRASKQGWDDFTCRFCELAKHAPEPSAAGFANDRPYPRDNH